MCTNASPDESLFGKRKGHQYAVVNVNTFEGVDRSIFQRLGTNFDGEDTESRLDRRRRTWIPSVSIDNRQSTSNVERMGG